MLFPFKPTEYGKQFVLFVLSEIVSVLYVPPWYEHVVLATDGVVGVGVRDYLEVGELSEGGSVTDKTGIRVGFLEVLLLGGWGAEVGGSHMLLTYKGASGVVFFCNFYR